jgi:hypothetical protein
MDKRMFLRILRSTKVPQPPTLKDVYEWVSTLATEQTYWNEDSAKGFFINPVVNRLMFMLKNAGQTLIGIIGLQGTGKTRTLEFLQHKFDTEKTPALLIHWTPDALEQLKHLSDIHQTYKDTVFNRAYDKAEAYAKAFKPLLGKVPDHTVLGALDRGSMPLDKAELMLGKSECEKAKTEAVYEYLSRVRYLFIDLPDYTKKRAGNMGRDIGAVHTLWITLASDRYETYQILVLGVQKEMYEKYRHFFFGKMDIVELEPFKPEELVSAYKQKWETFDIFTEDALLHVARLGRGVFRRFLKYLKRCIEESYTTGFPITTETVKNVITLDQIAKDMDLELSDVFKNKEQKVTAVKLLDKLRERGKINQKEMAEFLDINEMAISRLVKTLEANGYITRKRAERGEYLLSLV